MLNLPSFQKGEVLRAADLQALSDAVAGVRAEGRYVGLLRGAPPERFDLRTPLRASGDGRIIAGYDNPAFAGMGEDAQGKLLATGYGYVAGATTTPCEMRGTAPVVVPGTEPGFKGELWQSLCIDKVGKVRHITGVYTGSPKPGKWWGDASEGGSECGGGLTFLLGCVRENPCATEDAPAHVRYYFRRHQQLQVPHIAVNACMCEGTVPLVLKHRKSENVSRVRRLKAGAGVSLVCCENFVEISASGGGLRPINPPGCWCGCDGGCEVPAGGCGCCEVVRPVQLVGCEYPAGAPVGVIVRQLVGRAGAAVRRSCCLCETVEVVSKVPVNVCVCGVGGSLLPLVLMRFSHVRLCATP